MMRKQTKTLLLALFGLSFLALIPWVKPRLEERLPDAFRLDKVALDMQEDLPEFEMPDLSFLGGKEFHYIGHGGQAVAFASQDNCYVLKFFLKKQLHGEKRFPIPKPTHWISSHREKRQAQREQKRHRSLMKAMKNYSCAYQKMREKTGIIALHLNASFGNLPQVTLKDQYGNRYPIDLNQASFVFQHKAELVQEKLHAASDPEKQAILSKLNRFFEERAKEGFIDIERSFMIEANYGFLGDTPIQLDVGNIEFLESQKKEPASEIQRIQDLLHNWARNQGLPSF